MKKRIGKVILVIAAIIILGAVTGCFYTVQPNQYVAVRQFGRIVKIAAAMQVGVSIRTWNLPSSSSWRSSLKVVGFLPTFLSMSALKDEAMFSFHTRK